ncbi:hypothetical protein RB597_008193 [Gaeumannomyces tritici]
MHNLEALRSGTYKTSGLAKLKLVGPLESFPTEILELGETLEHLDLSGTGLSTLPDEFGTRLPRLKIAFFSDCNFATFPRGLAGCPFLEMVAFRGNGMTTVPGDSFPPRLRWLILTNNQIEKLPASIGTCSRLQKCMLAGNRLTELPDEMSSCQKLGLLRLSANRLAKLPNWLFELPELAFLSFAGNPCASTRFNSGRARRNSMSLPQIHWSNLEIHHILGEGASGIISKGVRRCSKGSRSEEEVAVKLFKGSLTSDGTPADELEVCMSAGSHENLIDALGRIHGHPDASAEEFRGGLVMQLIPPFYRTLGKPPTLESCTRDHYDPDAALSPEAAMGVLSGIASAARHLHANAIAHGDLYAHNILVSGDGHALLGDMGAATIYGDQRFPLLEKLEVLAFSHLIEDVLGLMGRGSHDDHAEVREQLQDIHRQCSAPHPSDRPGFAAVIEALRGPAELVNKASLPN